MKLKTSLKLVLIFVAILCIGIFTYAITKSSMFNSSAGPKLSQQAIAQKLYHAPHHAVASKPVVPKPKNSPKIVATSQSTSTATPVVATPAPLPNTGPGNIAVIFSLTSAGGALGAYIINIKRQIRNN